MGVPLLGIAVVPALGLLPAQIGYNNLRHFGGSGSGSPTISSIGSLGMNTLHSLLPLRHTGRAKLIANLAKRAAASSRAAVSRLNRQNGRDAAKLGLAALCAVAALSVGMRAELAQIEPAATQVRLHALPGPAQVEVDDSGPPNVPVRAPRPAPPRSQTESGTAQKQRAADCQSRFSTVNTPFDKAPVPSKSHETQTTQVGQLARPWVHGGVAAWTCSGKATGSGLFRNLPDRHHR